MRELIYATVLFGACVSAQSHPERQWNVPYDMAQPTRVLELQMQLVEVSALTDVDDTTVACLHDEAATVYFLSLLDGSVTDSVPFGGPSDMEGLTRVGAQYYALRSDGFIFHLDDRGKRLAILDTFRIDVQNRDIEGLGFDEATGMLLISPKDLLKGAPELRDERPIYAIDPRSTDRSTRVVLRLSMKDLTAQAESKGITLPIRVKKDGQQVSALKLRYSSVAVHPITDHYYLLSAADRTMLVVDRGGGLVDLVLLDEGLLPKPEGITFTANGDLWLSSEGKGRTPVLVNYALKKAR